MGSENEREEKKKEGREGGINLLQTPEE